MPPLLLLSFANDRQGQFLRGIAEEQRAIRKALDPLVQRKLVQVEVLANATAEDIFGAFRTYGDRIQVFHYGGHAQDLELLLSGAERGLDMQGLAQFLGEQKGLELVFMNGCATAAQQQPLQAAGIPRLILTETIIQDQAALQFATQVYQGLAVGHSVSRSFKEAEGATTAQVGGTRRSLVLEAEEEVTDEGLPWRLHEASTGDWSLPTKAPFPWARLAVALGILLVISGSGYALWKHFLPFDMEIRAQYPSDTGDEHFRFTHKLILELPDRELTEDLEEDASLVLDQLTGQGLEVPVVLESPLWELEDSLLSLESGRVPLTLTWKEELTRIQGKVVDQETQTPLYGATVVLGSQQTQTNAQGQFELVVPEDWVPRLSHSITALHASYEARNWTINLSDGQGSYVIPLEQKEG
ncbi:MAG: CHAT domain-containing protein [Bacteroidota bacterium]